MELSYDDISHSEYSLLSIDYLDDYLILRLIIIFI